MKHVATLVLALAVATAPSAARAEWYGGETLASDAISMTVSLTGTLLHNKPVWLVGLAGFVVGSPIVHAAHGNAQSAAISFGLHAAGPLAVYAIARNEKQVSNKDLGKELAILLVISIGVAAGIAIDSAVLARKDDDAMPAPRMVSFGGHF